MQIKMNSLWLIQHSLTLSRHNVAVADIVGPYADVNRKRPQKVAYRCTRKVSYTTYKL